MAPKTKKDTTKKVAKKSSSVKDPLFQARPRNFRVGGDIRPKKRDLSRFVRWPKNVRLQRQKKILYQRLKVPPAIDQFNDTLDKNQATELFKLLVKYQPETKAAKVQRLREMAAAKESGKPVKSSKPPPTLKFGLKHVTYLIENKKAALVAIAYDVAPIDLVVWLPALCRKMGVPYCIVKNKARLGTLCHKKNAAVIALTDVAKEDKSKLDTLAKNFTAQFNESLHRKWGGGVMGLKTQRKLEKREKLLAEEAAKKAQF